VLPTQILRCLQRRRRSSGQGQQVEILLQPRRDRCAAIAHQSRAQQADRLGMVPLFSHPLRQHLIRRAQRKGQMWFGVELALGQLLFAKFACLTRITCRLGPLLHRSRFARHPRERLEVLRRDAARAPVIAQLRLGSREVIPGQPVTDVADQVSLSRQRSNPEHNPRKNQPPLPHMKAHNLKMNQTLESCKQSPRRPQFPQALTSVTAESSSYLTQGHVEFSCV
jgi:hypothetical protein